MLAEVTTLYETNARSIPDMLRQCADTLENDPDASATAMVAVQLDENGNVQVYGWGDTNTVHAAGLLHMGLQKVVDMWLEDGDANS